MKLPRPRLRMRTTLALTAVIAVGLGIHQAIWGNPIRYWSWILRLSPAAYDRFEATRNLFGSDSKPEGREAVPPLLKALKDPDPVIRGTAATALGKFTAKRFATERNVIGPALVAALRDSKQSVRVNSISSLTQLAWADDRFRQNVSPVLVAALEDSETRVRITAAHFLVRRGYPEGKAALLRLLKHADATIRSYAILALDRWSRTSVDPNGNPVPVTPKFPSGDIISAILNSLDDPVESVRLEACGALHQSHPNRVVPVLIRALESKEHRYGAVYYLGEIGPKAKPAVARLVEIMKSADSSTRSAAIHSLGKIGPGAVPAVPDLIQALSDRTRMWRHPDFSIPNDAATALGRIGPGAVSAVPALIEVAKTRDIDQRRSAIEALGMIGPGARAAVPTLINALDDGEFGGIRIEVVKAVGRIGPDAREAIPALRRVESSGEDSFVADAATRAIELIQVEKGARDPPMSEDSPPGH